jgi:hypothetical protein
MIPQSLAASPLTKHAWLWQRVIAQCTTDALKVLAALDIGSAYEPSRRMTDVEICRGTGLHHRSIIDLRGELLKAGVVMCTDSTGTFIVLPGSDLGQARHDVKNMHDRAVAIHDRAKHLRQAIDRYEQNARPAESTGQGMLGLPVAGGTHRSQMEAFTR